MPDPIIPGALFPGDMCTLAGENHSGKSLLMYHIGIRLAEGKPLNLSEKRLFPPSRYHVIMYDRENNDMTLSKRYGNLSIKNLKVIRGFEFKTIDELLDDLELQLNSIDKGQNVLACIDNATAFKMPVSGSKITDFYTRLQSIIDKEEVFNKHLTVIIAAHLSSSSTSKNDDARVLGATQLISGASANLYIKNTRFGKHKKILKATKNRLEDWPEQVFLLNVIDTAPWHFEFEKMMDEKDALPETGSRSKGPIPSSSSQKEAILDQEPTTEPKAATDKETIIITLARKGKTKIEIHRETGISRPTINKYWPDDLPTKPGDQSK
jgi:recombinational DNA repair protein RecT